MFRSEWQKVIYDQKFRILISEQEIADKIKELGKSISKDYEGIVPILIGVLNGGFIFMADLFRQLEIDCEIDFIKISSYGNDLTSSGNVKVLKETMKDMEFQKTFWNVMAHVS